MAISAAPKKKPEIDIALEEKQLEIINKGGKPVQKVDNIILKKANKPISKNGAKGLKGITLLLTMDEAETIEQLRNKRPTARGKKIAISLHDWIVEAVQEKMILEKKQYKF